LPAWARICEALTGRVRCGLGIDPVRQRVEMFAEHNLAVTMNVAPQLGPTGQLGGHRVRIHVEDLDGVSCNQADNGSPALDRLSPPVIVGIDADGRTMITSMSEASSLSPRAKEPNVITLTALFRCGRTLVSGCGAS
jgi:hypothetical protein